jgi:hypothetical protein
VADVRCWVVVALPTGGRLRATLVVDRPEDLPFLEHAKEWLIEWKGAAEGVRPLPPLATAIGGEEE